MDRPAIALLYMIVLLATLLACAPGNPPGGGAPGDIDNVQAERIIVSDTHPLILDVRTPEEYVGELGHIPGARLMPLNLLQDSLVVLSQFKDREIIAVCRTGRRSGIAAEQLAKGGFDKVYNLKGGMVQWTQNGGKTE